MGYCALFLSKSKKKKKTPENPFIYGSLLIDLASDMSRVPGVSLFTPGVFRTLCGVNLKQRKQNDAWAVEKVLF